MSVPDIINLIIALPSLTASIIALFLSLHLSRRSDSESANLHRETQRYQHELTNLVTKIEKSEELLQGMFSESLRTGHELGKDLGEQRTSLTHLSETLAKLSDRLDNVTGELHLSLTTYADRYFALLPGSNQMQAGQAEQREKIAEGLRLSAGKALSAEAVEQAATQVQQALNKLPNEVFADVVGVFDRSGGRAINATQWALALGSKYPAGVFQILHQARDEGLLAYEDPIGRDTVITLTRAANRSERHG